MKYDKEIEPIFDDVKKIWKESKDLFYSINYDSDIQAIKEALRCFRTVKSSAFFLNDAVKNLLLPLEYALLLMGRNLIRPDKKLIDLVLDRIKVVEDQIINPTQYLKPAEKTDPLQQFLENVVEGGEASGYFREFPIHTVEGSETGLILPYIIVKSRPSRHDYLYYVHLSLKEYLTGKSLVPLIRRLTGTCDVLYVRFEYADIKEDEEDMALSLLFSTILEPEYAAMALDQDVGNIHSVEEPELKVEPPSFLYEHFEFKISEDLLEHFAVEASESLDHVEQLFLNLSEDNGDKEEDLNEVFREIHSLKGNAGFVGLTDFEKITHALESLLVKVRETGADDTCLQLMIEVVDKLKYAINRLMKTGEVGINGCGIIIDKLNRMVKLVDHEEIDKVEPVYADGLKVSEEKNENIIPAENETHATAKTEIEESMTNEIVTADAPRKDSEDGHGSPILDSDQKLIETGELVQEEFFSNEIISDKNVNGIKVNFEKLDQLVNLVGELVIAEPMVTANSDLEGLELNNFDKAAHNLKRIIYDLQDITMSVRMVPLRGALTKMKKLVKDLALENGKSIQLHLNGEDTEVDKTVIEKITDPLKSIIRNAVEGGIEPPKTRLKRGKSETGNITVTAGNEGSDVVIHVTDDGRGVNRERIINQAVQQGIFKGNPDELSDNEVAALIFTPGFAKSDGKIEEHGDNITMDVIHRNLERLNGRLTVNVNPGNVGISMSMYIPQTLAIMDGMVVRVGKSRYTLPLLAVCESFQAKRKNLTISPDGTETIRLRDEMLPVVRIHEVFNTEPLNQDLEKGILILVQSGMDRACLFVDDILWQQQTVIKALPSFVKDARGLSGCTILGDGEVSLIIDVGRLFDRLL